MPDREDEIERICQAALECPSHARADLLMRECRGDEEMRREIEALLSFESVADQFLEKPPIERIGPYVIKSTLGVGGMGEVYRAYDTVLGREVALKVLPSAFDTDPERVARLHREARTLATLTHPNIAHIYGIEQGALVMELVDGGTLKGPLPVGMALDYASQIAAALEAAHEKGIVHRDLKPTNIMTTLDGTVKVLDFGLAAAQYQELDDRSEASGRLSSPGDLTRVGAIMGTAAYMSPEQASGKTVDKRTDIWSFGVVVWELFTGSKLFEGDTIDEVLSAVRKASVNVKQLPSGTPPPIRHLLARFLDPDPRTRLIDIGEARIQIQKLVSDSPKPAKVSTERLFRFATFISAGLALLFAVLFAFERRQVRRAESAVELTFHISAPPSTTFASGPALSPDGRQVAFTARSSDGHVRIWIYSLRDASAYSLAGTEEAFSPLFWSPNSRFVGFATAMTLSKVSAAGGPRVALCDRCGPVSIGSRVFRGASWSSSGVIVYAISSNGLWRIPDTGGTPRRVTAAGDYGYPVFLPNSDRFLYTWFGHDPRPGVYIKDLASGEQHSPTPLIEGALVASGYLGRDGQSAGHLFALREGVLTARTFNPSTARVDGEATVIAEDVPTVEPPAAFSTSSTGTIAFNTSTSADRSRLVWFDHSGRELGQLGPPSYGSNISISSDGMKIASDTTDSDRRTRHIWTADPIRGVVTLVNTGARNWTPAISRSGDIAFNSTPDIFLARHSTVDSSEPLYHSPYSKLPNNWSPDGHFLIFNELHPTRRGDLYVFRMETREAVPLVVTDADEWPAVFSPNGKWIAYSSDETGTREVYVRDFAPGRVPAIGALKVRVSTKGGDKPRWGRDGRELFYISLDQQLMAAPVRTRPAFGFDLPVALFNVRLPTTGFPYDVAPDGRFLIDTLESTSADESSKMTVILNWDRKTE